MGSEHRRHRGLRLTVRTILVIVVVLSLALAVFGVRLWTGVKRVDLTAPGAGSGATNYLLVGSDSREPVQGAAQTDAFGTTAEVPGERADLIMVLHVPATGAPTLLTVPRDTLVAFPQTAGTHRLTLALTRGPQVLIDTMCSAFGLGIDHLAIIDFEGFRRLIDLVGGIDIDFDAPTRDTMSGLVVPEAGRQHLDGDQALALVRSRQAEERTGDDWHPTRDGANRRVRRAQDVMRALAPPAAAMAGSPWGKVRVASAVGGNVTVDAAMGRGDVDRVLDALRAVESGPPDSMREVPVTLVDGPIPTATLAAGAPESLRAIGAGTSATCPHVPDATSTPSSGDPSTPAAGPAAGPPIYDPRRPRTTTTTTAPTGNSPGSSPDR